MQRLFTIIIIEQSVQCHLCWCTLHVNSLYCWCVRVLVGWGKIKKNGNSMLFVLTFIEVGHLVHCYLWADRHTQVPVYDRTRFILIKYEWLIIKRKVTVDSARLTYDVTSPTR
jgi:Tfp pilus assembly ATPase PilU